VLDAQRRDGESRAAAARRLLALDTSSAKPSRADTLRAGLLRIPGVSQEAAQRVVLSLGDKIDSLSLVEAMREAVRLLRPETQAESLTGALVKLGFHRPDVERAVARALPIVGDLSFGDTMREVMRLLPRKDD